MIQRILLAAALALAAAGRAQGDQPKAAAVAPAKAAFEQRAPLYPIATCIVSGEDLDVAQKEPLAGIEKGDVFEARLVPYAGERHFTQAFLWHPREARKLILKEAKRRRKTGDSDPVAFARELARLSLKRERYRTAQVEHIYKFT